MSLIHHLCKRETKRNAEAIICLVSSRLRFLYYIHTVLYSIHGVLHGTGPANSRNTEKSGVPQVSVKCKKWVWSGCTAAMCLKRVQSPHGNDSNGNNNGEVREEKENPGAFFWAHELEN